MKLNTILPLHVVSILRSHRGYSGVWMTTLFAYRATEPSKINIQGDPIGTGNDNCLN
jgi:hypothetical protein